MAAKTVTVRPSGGTYTIIDAAIDGELVANANLVTMDGILNIDIEGSWSSADTTYVSVDGFTTDSTRYVKIQANSDNRFDGAFDTGRYRLVVNHWGPAMNIADPYTRIIGIQVENAGSGPCYKIDSVAGAILDSCLAREGGGRGFEIGINTTGHRAVLANCAAISCVSDGFAWQNSAMPIYAYNCVSIANGGYGFRASAYDASYLTNCYAGGNTGDDFRDMGSATITTCRSEDGTASTPTSAYTTSTLTSVTAGSEDVTLPSGSGLVDAGTSLASDSIYPFNWDATNATRSGTWDIGPFERVSTGGGVTIPRIIHHLRMQGVAA